MKKIVSKYVEMSLIIRILIGLIIGAAIGLLFPGKAAWVGILGDVFVGALKGIAPILVFVLVMSSIAKAQGNIGSRFRTVITLYLVSTLLAAVVAVLGSFIFPVKIVLDEAVNQAAPSGIAEVLKNLLTNMVSNPISALANANYLGVLFWAVILGLGLKKIQKPQTANAIGDLAEITSMGVRWVIQIAPFGILGLVYGAVAESGLGIFTTYGKLVALLVGCMLVVALVVDPFIAFLYLKRNPYPLVFRCLKESGLTAFFTRSSAANIPVNMELCKKLGLDEDFYSVSIPLGATINMDGAAITINVMTLAVCATLGINVDIPTAILLSILATLGACGA